MYIMFKRHLPLAGLAALSIFAFAACQGTAIDNQAKSESSDSTRTLSNASVISEFPLRESIKNASESYKISSTKDTFVYYLTLTASVQWPETLGDYKINNLRDTIISKTFGPGTINDINNAITNFVTDAKQYELGDRIERIDSEPVTGVNEFYASRSLQLVECTEQTATYTAAYTSFLGGAHPSSGANPFSFDLANDRMIDMKYLFIEGADKKLEPMIVDAIAMSHSLTTDELKPMLFTSPMKAPFSVYILNSQIGFHFNPYDILPYSFGATDAFITPYEVSDLLTPEAKQLLLE